MKKIYVAFLSTDTRMGRFIRRFTRYAYNHVAISFSPDLEVMYSFARYRHCSPFVGGFVAERPERYYAESGDTRLRLYELQLSDERYERARHIVEDFSRRSEQVIYNSFAALMSFFNLNIHIRDSYTCVEFVSDISGTERTQSIRRFESELDATEIYCGSYRDYVPNTPALHSDYLERQTRRKVALSTVWHFASLIKRVFTPQAT